MKYLGAVFLALLVSGCAVLEEVGHMSQISQHRSKLEDIQRVVGTAEAELDAGAVEARWGGLPALADRRIVEWHTTMGAFAATYKWIVPGRIMEFRRVHMDSDNNRATQEGFYYFDEKSGRLKTSLARGMTFSADLFVKLKPDGFLIENDKGELYVNVTVDPSGYDYRTIGFGVSHWTYKATFHSEESFQRYVARRMEQQYADRQARRQAEANFFAALNTGLQGVGQAYAEQRATPAPALVLPPPAATPTPPARPAARNPSSSAPREPARPHATARAPAQAARPQPVAPVAPIAAVQRPRPEAQQRQSNLRQYYEAIMVCTKPSGAKGRFECRTPVTSHRGHLEDISGHRTPEEMVDGNEGCPDPRMLASTTHLVWGCGFGATNNPSSMDRSAGVDVKGRRSYYCSEKQSSCRRTEP